MLEYRFKLRNGDEERVIVAGDVVALPDRNWSGGGYGVAVSVEWMLHSGKLPKVSAELRRELAGLVVRALELRQMARHARESA